MDVIVRYLLKSEVGEEYLSIWSNIELVWMESQMNFSALLLRRQSSVSPIGPIAAGQLLLQIVDVLAL